MEDDVKNGNNNGQILFEEILKNYTNPFAAMLIRNNVDLFNKLNKNIINFYKDYSKAYEKFADLYKPNNCKMIDKKGTFPANGHDIYNYIARYSTGSYQIQVKMRLNGRLDFDKLKRAVRLSVKAEPVFGCKFVEDNPPYWKPLENIGMVSFCSFEETDNVNEAVLRSLESTLDMDNDPNVKVKLIRSEQYDVLCVKINHACCDAAGTKEYIQLLSDIYSTIDQENGTFMPEPRIAGRKDQDRLFANLGITNPDALFIPGADISIPTWPFPWRQSSSNTACPLVCRISCDHLDKMKKYAKARSATINDLVLTAYYRAMLEMGQPIYGLPMEIPITVDLRRYLPDHKTRAIRNFSGSVNTRLTMLLNEPFCGTLSRVVNMMKEIKKEYPGLQSALGLERIERLNIQETLAYYQVSPEAKKPTLYCPLYYGDKCIPSLSNIGYISQTLIKFGNATVTDAYIVPPVLRPPGFMLVAGTYNSVLTLSACYYKDTVLGNDVEGLLSKVGDELIQVCKG